MFQKLDEVESHFKEIEEKLQSSDVVSNQPLFQKLSKEHSSLQPVVVTYREYRILKTNQEQNEAIVTLYRHYAKENDTQGLYRVLLRLADSDPSNLDVQNNLAQISLLLNAQPEEARRMAAEIFRKNPSNPAY